MPESLTPPRRILLATDLSCRCDRALDRAVELSHRWGARLIIAHVMAPDRAARLAGALRDAPAWHRAPDAVERMRWRIRRDLADDRADVEICVEEGDPAERLLAVAREKHCDLIVTGIARNEMLGRIFVGTTINQLVRQAPAPVLVVKDRASRAYQKIAVATDFSDSSRHALAMTVGCFPKADIVLLHGYDFPFAGFRDKEEFRERRSAMEAEFGAEFLAATPIEEAQRKRIRLLIERGNPERLIWEYVRHQEVDLTVIGSHGRGALFDMVIGSMTKRLLESAAGDLLIVVDPRMDG